MRLYFKIGFVIVMAIGFLFTIEYCIENAMSNVREGEIGKINAVVQHELDHEMTIWGASTAYVHFDAQKMTDKLGLSVFNMGIDGTNIDQYYGLLKEYLEYTENSKFLVIAMDIHGGFMKRQALYNIHKWTHHLSNDNIKDCFSTIDSQLMCKCGNVPFYNLTVYNKHNFRFVRNSMLSTDSIWSFPQRGYAPNPVSKMKLGNQIEEKQKVEINESVSKKIKDACILAKSKGITPIIVITPCFIQGYEGLVNAEEVVSSIQKYEEVGAKVFNYSQCDISKDPSLFNDYTHLNEKGADQFSELFAEDFMNKLQNKNN
jgi:hypothetical protein